MARLRTTAGWAPKSPKEKPKPTRRAYPPPAQKERSLGKLGDVLPIDWDRVFEARCLSKRGMQITDEQATLVKRAHALDPKRYAALNDKVFEATKPFGARGVG